MSRQTTTPRQRPTRPRRARRRQGGFTLIEAALTTVIIGVGVLALVESQQAYHRKNEWARRSGVGMLLANELREMTLPMPLHDPLTGTANLGFEDDELSVEDYDDVDDFAGTVDEVTGVGTGTHFSTPVNALGQEIDGLDGWEQDIQVVNVLPGDLSGAAQPIATTPLMRLTVTVTYLEPGDVTPTTISQLSWVVSD